MLRIVRLPASYPVTLAEAKAQLRATDTSNDVMISRGQRCNPDCPPSTM
ncbi:hypothetical protein [Bradyrhizobium sp. 76]|nr:hypothetical protein [Bradyrhizobium sp. 76]MCK1404909.1 hypothetical protein [Bradyrhizobium sp. 76]